FLTHSPGQQSLTQAVVDLVGAGVVQIFSLEIDFSALPGLRQPLCEIERRWPSRVVVEQIIKFRLECSIALRFHVCSLEFLQRMHQRFRKKLAAVLSKMAVHGAPIRATSAR